MNDFTGALAPVRPSQQRPQHPTTSPDGRRAPEGYRWDARFADNPQLRGFIPDTWDFNEIERQLTFEDGRRRYEADAPQRQAQAERQAAEQAEERERERLRTPEGRCELLEARVTALEAKLEKLTQPTSLASRSRATPRRTTRGSGNDMPPRAA
jgi:hypothetical protein